MPPRDADADMIKKELAHEYFCGERVLPLLKRLIDAPPHERINNADRKPRRQERFRIHQRRFRERIEELEGYARNEEFRGVEFPKRPSVVTKILSDYDDVDWNKVPAFEEEDLGSFTIGAQ
jgi:hypothetical protein